jgi:L-lactate dehydrogenase complex protein LldE
VRPICVVTFCSTLGIYVKRQSSKISFAASTQHAKSHYNNPPATVNSMPKIGLFVPCYIDQLYPQVGMATLRVLQHLGLDVEFPEEQTCCGQPMANAGCAESARPLAERFLEIFGKYDQVVAPSGSCVSMVRNHYAQWLKDKPGFDRLRVNAFELCEYLVDVAHVSTVDGDFPRRVGILMSCHGMRELRLGRSSELMVTPFNKVQQLIAQLRGIELVQPTRPDECCGFGGTFAVNEEALSCMMGRDRIAEAEIIAGYDMSCLMHLDGLIRRAGKSMQVMHVAEMLQGVKLS